MSRATFCRLPACLLIAIIALFAASSSHAGIPGAEHNVRKASNQVVVELINPRPCELTVALTWKLENMTAAAKQPLVLVLKPHTTIAAVTFRVTDPSQKYNYRFDYEFTWGSPKTQHDPQQLYALPYAPERRFVITQGAGGKFSHTGDNFNAIDFGLPLRTPVTAARAGLAVLTLDGFTESKNDPAYKDKANLIYVRHDDGTIGEYVHLSPQSLKVKVGDRVRPGQVLALSGNTGYATEAHLHFMVFRGKDGKERESLPIRFIAAEGNGLKLEQGKSYTAVPVKSSARIPTPGDVR